MNSIALRPIISAGKYPMMASALGLTCIRVALGIRHQDQVLRGFEDAAPFLDLLAEGLLGPLALGNVAGDLGCADDCARRRLDRRDAERNLDRAAVLAQPYRFAVIDSLAAANPAQHVVRLRGPVGGNDEVDTLADGFRRGKPEQALRRRIPPRYRAVQRRRDDGVVGRFDGGAEQAFARRIMVARGLGAAMLLHFAFECLGLGTRLTHHARKGLREHADLAACSDRNRYRVMAAGPFNGGGQLNDRPGERPRNQHGQCSRAQYGDQPDQQRTALDRRQRRQNDGIWNGFDDPDPFAAGQHGGSERGCRPAARLDPARYARRSAWCRATMPVRGSRPASWSACPAPNRIRGPCQDEPDSRRGC